MAVAYRRDERSAILPAFLQVVREVVRGDAHGAGIYRSGRKKARMSSTSRAGSSNAAK
jgi:hypothetical protein